jgi:ubiquinone/menaquinone biosynthesis C-methylase UbiE
MSASESARTHRKQQRTPHSYDFWSHRYDQLWTQKYSLGPSRAKVIEFLRSLRCDPARPFRLLDMGCGTGQLLQEIAGAFPQHGRLELKGIDASPGMIEVARTKDYGRPVVLEVRSIDEADEPAGSFDLIACTHSLHYYPDPLVALGKLSRWLRPGGHCILVQAFTNTRYDRVALVIVRLLGGRCVYYSIPTMLGHLADHGFEVVSVEPFKLRRYMPTIAAIAARKAG